MFCNEGEEAIEINEGKLNRNEIGKEPLINNDNNDGNQV